MTKLIKMTKIIYELCKAKNLTNFSNNLELFQNIKRFPHTRCKVKEYPNPQPAEKIEVPSIPPSPNKQANVIEIVRTCATCTGTLSKAKPNRTVNVTILNASTDAAVATAFYLKQHPLIKKIFLHGGKLARDTARDLQDIDTNANVKGFELDRELPDALRVADIVILMDFSYRESDVEAKFECVAPRVRYLTEEIGLYAPRAVILNCIEPICCTMPLLQAKMTETALYDPGKIVGCISNVQARVNSVAAKYLSLDPETVHVPLIGGCDLKTLVPLISLMQPNPYLCDKLAEDLYYKLQGECVLPDCFSMAKSLMSDGYAIAQFAIAVARGLTGAVDSYSSCLMRTNVIQMISYIATTVRFGRLGVEQNYGVPRMTNFETKQFVRAINVLLERQKMVSCYIMKNVC